MTDAGGLEFVMALAAGLGLAAASGFRVFVPLLGVSLASRFGQFEPSAGFAWVASPVAMVALSFAVAVEVGAYLVPWLDNMLDTVATPAAVIAGTVLTALMLGDASPALQWILAVVAGGGTAGVVQAGTVALRGASLVTTGGVANPVVSTAEAAMSGLLTVLAILVPLVALALLVFGVLWWRRRRSRRADAGALLVLVALSSAGGCASSPEGTGGAGNPASAVASEPAEPAVASHGIPPGHLPPAGQCRVWMPGEPPGQQKKTYPVGRCSELRASIPDGAWLVYRPTDDERFVRVWQYGADGVVLSQRIYDATTGDLIRHVGPTGH